MAFLPFALGDDARRRRLAEYGLAVEPGVPVVTPINPDASRPPALPNLPSGPAPRPRPRILSIPGPMPGAEEPSPFPETAMPNALPLPARGAPGAMSAPPLPPELAGAITLPQSRGRQIQEAKDVYMVGTPGRFKSAAQRALGGFGEGLASSGGLGAGVGGAVAGALFGGLNPRGAREKEFDERVLPKIKEGFAMEDAETMARRAAAKEAAERALAQANISNINSQIQSRTAQDALNQQRFEAEQGKLENVAPGGTVFDPRTRKPVFTAPDRPKQPTAADLDIDPDTGRSWQEQADFAYNDRGGDQYVYDRLPERTRRILESDPGAVSPAEVASAQSEFQTAISRQRQLDREYSRGAIRAKHVNRRATAPGSPQGASRPQKGSGVTYKRNVNELPPLR